MFQRRGGNTMTRFIKIDNSLIPDDSIEWIDCSKLESETSITIHFYSMEGEQTVIKGQPAVDLVLKLCPEYLEGKRFKFIRHAWAIHNTIAHPLLQIFSWLKMHKIGFWVHDNTVPTPRK